MSAQFVSYMLGLAGGIGVGAWAWAVDKPTSHIEFWGWFAVALLGVVIGGVAEGRMQRVPKQ